MRCLPRDMTGRPARTSRANWPRCDSVFERSGRRFAWRKRVKKESGASALMQSEPKLQRSPHAEEIPLADLDAVVAQNAVGSGGVEIEIREGEVEQVLLPGQR